MKYDKLKDYMLGLSKILWAKPYGDFEHPCIVVTGNNSSYPSQLWDWGNWVNNIALRQIAIHQNKQDELLAHEKGSVMNFLNEQKDDGSIEIVIFADKSKNFCNFVPHRNIHKPVLAQHVAFINKYNPDKEWVKEIFPKLKAFNAYYENNAKHESGLFFFFDDFAIGVDNDPATFYRPDNSSASIYINTLMYCELGALSHLAEFIGNTEDADYYKTRQLELKNAINEHCYDEKGFWAPYGVRSLSKYEKMYRLVGTGNPSSWHGGVWILSNYFVIKGLLRYGYKAEGEELAIKTLDLLNKDFEKNGAFHEYYNPETGEGIFNKGFSSWNLLAFNLLEYFDGKEVIEEFFI